MTYLVVFESEEFAVAADTLANALRTDWPQATVRRNDPPAGTEVRDVEWELPYGTEQVEGHSHVDGTCIYLDGPIDPVAQLALWYRGLVPEGIDVIFCDEGYAFDVAVSASTTKEELIGAAEA